MTAKILNYPNNPDELKWLMSQERLLWEDLQKQETYDERVETRKELRRVQKELKASIQKAL